MSFAAIFQGIGGHMQRSLAIVTAGSTFIGLLPFLIVVPALRRRAEDPRPAALRKPGGSASRRYGDAAAQVLLSGSADRSRCRRFPDGRWTE